jgi:hypothetical protein
MDVWFREDVVRVVGAARQAARAGMEAPAIGDNETAAYWRGYMAALATIAAAFGIDAEAPRAIEMIRVEKNW